MSVGQFQMVLRTKINLKPTEAIFLFIGNTIPKGSLMFEDIDREYTNPVTGMVHIEYSGENVFG